MEEKTRDEKVSNCEHYFDVLDTWINSEGACWYRFYCHECLAVMDKKVDTKEACYEHNKGTGKKNGRYK